MRQKRLTLLKVIGLRHLRLLSQHLPVCNADIIKWEIMQHQLAIVCQKRTSTQRRQCSIRTDLKAPLITFVDSQTALSDINLDSNSLRPSTMAFKPILASEP